MPVEKVLTPDEAGEALGVSARRITELAKTGRIRAVKVGRSWRFPESALTEFITINTPSPPPPGPPPGISARTLKNIRKELDRRKS